MGVANSDAKLYDEELQEILATYPKQFRLDYALSREQKNSRGGKMYIQDKVEEYSDEVFDLLNNGAHIYFCGLKGMMPGTFFVPVTWVAVQAEGHDAGYLLLLLPTWNSFARAHVSRVLRFLHVMVHWFS
jgi:Oxidoreductase NAD-binding domain